MFPREVSHGVYQGEQNAAESTGAGTAFGKNGGSAEGGRPFAQGLRGCNSPGRSPEAAVSGQCPEVKPLGRVQGGSACSGVQRVKPLAQVGLMRASIRTGLLSGAKQPDSAASPPLATPRKAKNEKQEGEQNGKKIDPAQRESREKRRLQINTQ